MQKRHCLWLRAGIVRDVEGVRHLAELGVVFLLFNIGLELSLERLRSMQKFVFGLGGLQVSSSVLDTFGDNGLGIEASSGVEASGSRPAACRR